MLFQHDPEGKSEVVNDLNGALSNFWCVLRNEACFQRFVRTVQAIPFSAVEYEVHQGTPLDLVDWAVAFFVRYRQSRQGLGKDFATLSRNRTRRGMNEQVSSWLAAVEGLPAVHARLKRVVILNDDAIRIIRQQDGEKTLYYADPPYLHETRTATDCYEHEMDKDQHIALLDTLGNIRGKFLLSGYNHAIYEYAAKAYGWRRVDIEIDNKASGGKKKRTMTESLWMNF